MAKWGEGDPRWIVEERPDAINVNNWHWTEKNASQWSKDKLRELLVGLQIEDRTGICRVTDMTKVEGEASANNRKAKLIFFYEWVIKLEWKGNVAGSSDEIKGKVEIPNLSEENSPSEIDINVTVKSTSKEAALLKQLMHTEGVVQIRQRLSQYIHDLHDEFAAGMILPNKNGEVTANSVNISKNVEKKTSQTTSSESATKKLNKLEINVSNSKKCTETSEIVLRETFKCTADEMYNVLTIKEMVQAWTHGPCRWEPTIGGYFEIFDGNVCGTFLKLEPSKLLEMSWRFSSWPVDYFSTVTLEIVQKDDCTDVHLKQVGVPVNDLERTKSGWNRYYWESIKKTFGFGALLF